MDGNTLKLVAHAPSKVVFRSSKADLCDVSCSVLDTETIETFTLEGFKDLMVSYLRENRDFVIAKVTTQDLTTNSTFYSYYSAIELNKILFCIENSNSMLYRVRARNPINNLGIIGEVSYYKITPGIVEKALNDANSMEANQMVIEAEYFACDEDILFDSSIRKYFANNFPDEKEYFPRRFELLEGSSIVEEQLDGANDDKFSLKIILYTNIGTILTVFGMCMFLGSNEIFLTAVAPLTLTLFFSIFFLVLYVILFETPEGLTSIFNLRKTENA